MDERETILNFFKTTLWDVPGVKLVTRRDHRSLIGSLQEYPAICIVDGGDDPVGPDGRRQIWTRRLYVSFQIVYSGSTEDAAPSELAAFSRLVKKQLYSTRDQCDAIRSFRSQTISPLNPLKVGSKVVHQYLDFEVTYNEDIQQLLLEVSPTE